MLPINVLIVDDSAVVRQVLSAALAADPDIRVAGAVADPILAQRRMQLEWPDVVVLDIEMPRMDGLTFLRRLMAERPTPVVMCSSLTERGAEATMAALAAGAVDVITKPKLGLRDFLQEESARLVKTVKAAAGVRTDRLRTAAAAPRPAAPAPRIAAGRGRVVAVGASTGGTQALERVLTALPADCPGLVVVQHMPERFTAAFADRLNGLCRIEVREAANLDPVRPGLALIAPGNRHMLLRRGAGGYRVEVKDGPLVSRHRPSVDALFRSVARAAGPEALGIIMTGMGDDGAAGMLEMRQAGAHTLAQDEATCVVFGMPKEAIKRGAAVDTVPLEGIAGAIVGYSHG